MITKIIYRDQVKELLLDKMRLGKITAGQTLSLAAMARELNVSVTPIREALTQLQTSRIVKAIPNRGFIIPELDNNEARELYELVAHLETLAIEHSIFDDKTIRALEKQNQIFMNEKNSIKRVNADMKFHNVLTSLYKNKTAQSILADLKMRLFFYEIAFMNNELFNTESNTHHIQIINHIKKGQISEAKLVLQSNWLQILKFIE